MDKENIKEYASELSNLVQSFINDYAHPEDGILVIRLDNIEDKRVVYIEESLKPAFIEDDYAEYPLIDLMNDEDAPNEKWCINEDAILEIAEEILNV